MSRCVVRLMRVSGFVEADDAYHVEGCRELCTACVVVLWISIRRRRRLLLFFFACQFVVVVRLPFEFVRAD